MPLNRDDFVSILRHLQNTLRQFDPSLSDELLTVDAPVEDVRPYVFEYLDRLTTAIAARSGRTGQETLTRLNEFVRTESGQRIGDVSLVITGADQERFDRAEISLTERPDYSSVLEQLGQVRAMLHDEWGQG